MAMKSPRGHGQALTIERSANGTEEREIGERGMYHGLRLIFENGAALSMINRIEILINDVVEWSAPADFYLARAQYEYGVDAVPNTPSVLPIDFASKHLNGAGVNFVTALNVGVVSEDGTGQVIGSIKIRLIYNGTATAGNVKVVALRTEPQAGGPGDILRIRDFNEGIGIGDNEIDRIIGGRGTNEKRFLSRLWLKLSADQIELLTTLDQDTPQEYFRPDVLVQDQKALPLGLTPNATWFALDARLNVASGYFDLARYTQFKVRAALKNGAVNLPETTSIVPEFIGGVGTSLSSGAFIPGGVAA